MISFFLYLGRTSLYLAIFYAFFLLAMRRTSFFRLNRVALLLGTVACHLLPLLRLRSVAVTEEPEIFVGLPVETAVVVEETGADFPWEIALYLAGVAVVLLLTLLCYVRTRRILNHGETRPFDGFRLTLTEQSMASFSWFRHIVMSREDYEKFPAILRHERQHVRHLHSLDILLMTGVCAVHWFNPLVWLTRTELALLHEYEVDEDLINQGIDATQYQLLLVRKAVGERRFSLANGFDHTKLKQRITMMQKHKTPSRFRFAYVGILPVLAATLFVCNPVRARILPAPAPVSASAPVADNPPQQEESVPFNLVEKKPTFQGGNAGAFAKWVSENIVYPLSAKEANITGRVMVKFTVSSDGSVQNVQVLKGVDEALDAEAVRVVSSSPQWTPAEQGGKAVAVNYSFPVIFQLKESSAEPLVFSLDKVDKRPSFQDGDERAFAIWVSENLVYPEKAK
nr:TonB family protein [Bacteroidales bacterium]